MATILCRLRFATSDVANLCLLNNSRPSYRAFSSLSAIH